MNLEEVITAQTNIYRQGMSNNPAQRKLDAILRVYDDCKHDQSAKIPTRLMLALEAARLA